MIGTWNIIQVSGGTVVMPQAADDYELGLDAVVEHLGVDGGQEAAVSRYLTVNKLSLSGVLFYGAYTNSQLNGTYLTPLFAMVRKQVTFVTNDSQFSGTWLFISASFRHSKEYVNPDSYTYNLGFEQSTTEVVQ